MVVAELTPTRTAKIGVATAADAERVVATLTRAFREDPLVRWIYPNPVEYWTYWPEVLRAYAAGAFEHGTAYYADGFAGAALWLPPGIGPDEAALGELLERSIPALDQADAFGLLEQMSEAQPSESHWYLPFLGVEPSHQGNGYGSALLRHALARCDRDRLPAYLQATTPRNRRLYERHGFEVVGTVQVGSSPPMWPMLRAPR
jgi:ribosomal protein S18 acetylase RimI-like enzyme